MRMSSRRVLRSSESSSACSSNTVSCTLSSSFSMLFTSCRDGMRHKRETLSFFSKRWIGRYENTTNWRTVMCVPPTVFWVPILTVQSEYEFWSQALLLGWSEHWSAACSHPGKINMAKQRVDKNRFASQKQKIVLNRACLFKTPWERCSECSCQ